MPNPPVPPKRRESHDSFPAVTPTREEQIWQTLKGISEQLTEISQERGRDLARMQEIHEIIERHGEEIRELRDSMTIHRELRTDIRELRSELRELRKADRQHDTLLNEQDKSLMEQAESLDQLSKARRAGGAAGRKWATAITVLGMIIGTAVATAFQECRKDSVYPAQHPGQ